MPLNGAPKEVDMLTVSDRIFTNSFNKYSAFLNITVFIEA